LPRNSFFSPSCHSPSHFFECMHVFFSFSFHKQFVWNVPVVMQK
jgi:hypothetical protein